MVWGGTTMTRRTELHICQGNVTGLYCRDNATEPIVVPYDCRHGNAFIFHDDNAKSIVHVLSKITCSFAE